MRVTGTGTWPADPDCDRDCDECGLDCNQRDDLMAEREAEQSEQEAREIDV